MKCKDCEYYKQFEYSYQLQNRIWRGTCILTDITVAEDTDCNPELEKVLAALKAAQKLIEYYETIIALEGMDIPKLQQIVRCQKIVRCQINESLEKK